MQVDKNPYKFVSAFTLLELVIVIIIVGVLSSLAMTRFSKMIERSRSVEAIVHLKAMREATHRCYLMHGSPDFCFCLTGAGSLWDRLGLDNPGLTPNAHFIYLGFSCIPNQPYFTIQATRNTYENPSGSAYGGFTLQDDSTGTKVWGSGIYTGF